MSEEAVRQTRSQKRALQREAAPQCELLSDIRAEAKKPKLDELPLTAAAQTDPEPEQDGTGGTPARDEDEHLPLEVPEVAPKDDGKSVQRQQGAEQLKDDQTISRDVGSRTRTDTAVDAPVPRAFASILAATEMKATIKVEVQAGDEPVDMSTSGGIKGDHRPPSPEEDDDVIILSDNESPSPAVNGLSHCRELDTELLMRSSAAERERVIKALKEELRLEEAKLVLLKKLRQSQIQRDPQQKPTSTSAPPPLIRATATSNKGAPQIVPSRSSSSVIPPPLVRGGQLSSTHGAHVLMPPLVRGSQQQVQMLRQPQQLVASGGSGSGPPPLLTGSRTFQNPGQRGLAQQGLVRGSSSGLKGSTSGSGSATLVCGNDSPASRQAAAKLALRKQLEKTLLEIPPPKPPAPEFNFLPSAANNEFIYLVGLEEVVHNLLDSIHRSKTGVALLRPGVTEPFTCTQCRTDFTCRWRRDRGRGGGAMLCEDCMSSNQKKALKAEHTNRLKAAFVKALQQEQEIEQRIVQQTSSSSSSSHGTSSSSSTVASLKVEQLVSQHLKQAQARASALQHQASRGANVLHHHSIKQSSHGLSSVGVRGVAHSFSSPSQLQSAVAAAALVSRPGVTMAYVNPSLTGHKMAASVDARQREYLLDMIPSRSSISQTANTWK